MNNQAGDISTQKPTLKGPGFPVDSVVEDHSFNFTAVNCQAQ
jgi:hypothetical protein